MLKRLLGIAALTVLMMINNVPFDPVNCILFYSVALVIVFGDLL